MVDRRRNCRDNFRWKIEGKCQRGCGRRKLEEQPVSSCPRINQFPVIKGVASGGMKAVRTSEWKNPPSGRSREIFRDEVASRDVQLVDDPVSVAE